MSLSLTTTEEQLLSLVDLGPSLRKLWLVDRWAYYLDLVGLKRVLKTIPYVSNEDLSSLVPIDPSTVEFLLPIEHSKYNYCLESGLVYNKLGFITPTELIIDLDKSRILNTPNYVFKRDYLFKTVLHLTDKEIRQTRVSNGLAYSLKRYYLEPNFFLMKFSLSL